MEMKTLTVNGQTFAVTDSSALHFTPQDLTAQQQAQARQNIGLSAVTGFDPEKQITASHIPGAHFYKAFAEAIADLNAGTLGAAADASAETAVCALHKSADGETYLILLSDINLTENAELTQSVTLRLNGYVMSLLSGARLNIAKTAENCFLDGQVAGSKLVANVASSDSACAVAVLSAKQSYAKKINIELNVESAAENASSYAVVCGGSWALIEDSHIVCKVKSGGKGVSGIMYQSACNLTVKNSQIDVLKAASTAGSAAGIASASTAADLVLDGCRITVTAASDAYGIYLAGTSNRTINNCAVAVFPHEEKSGAFTGIQHLAGTMNMENTDVYVCPGNASSPNCNAIFVQGILFARKSTFFADGFTGSGTGTYGIAVRNYYGQVTLNDCAAYGTFGGVNCEVQSTTLINGGLYEGTGHGGLYLSNADGNFYAENAAFRSAPYRGKRKDQFQYGLQDRVAAIYIGGSGGASNLRAYFDNCVIDGTGPAMIPDGDAMIGAEPIRFRAGSGEVNNAIYLSNCTLQGDGQVRFAHISHRLYLGFGNRILTGFSIPDCVDRTTYAGKAFSNYEEEQE